MQVVCKYPLVIGNYQKLKLPLNAKPIRFGLQGRSEYPYLWALVDLEEDVVEREFLLVPTGQAISDDAELAYIGTATTTGDTEYVWHLFEVLNSYCGICDCGSCTLDCCVDCSNTGYCECETCKECNAHES